MTSSRSRRRLLGSAHSAAPLYCEIVQDAPVPARCCAPPGTGRGHALQFLQPSFDGDLVADGAPPTRFSSGTAAPEYAAAVSKQPVTSDGPRVRAYTASAVQNAWHAKQPMNYVNTRHARDDRASCCSSVRRASISASVSGCLAASGERRATSRKSCSQSQFPKNRLKSRTGVVCGGETWIRVLADGVNPNSCSSRVSCWARLAAMFTCGNWARYLTLPFSSLSG